MKYKSSTTAYYMINDYKAPSSTSSFINTSTQVLGVYILHT